MVHKMHVYYEKQLLVTGTAKVDTVTSYSYDRAQSCTPLKSIWLYMHQGHLLLGSVYLVPNSAA